MANQRQNFDRFMKLREQAAQAYVRGDAAPLDKILPYTSPATFFGPMGGHVRGTDAVTEKYDQDAKLFGSEGQTTLEVFETAADDTLAYWTGIQRAIVRIGDGGKAMPMDLRITEVFRREGDEWKLVHRHADTLIEPASR